MNEGSKEVDDNASQLGTSPVLNGEQKLHSEIFFFRILVFTSICQSNVADKEQWRYMIPFLSFTHCMFRVVKMVYKSGTIFLISLIKVSKDQSILTGLLLLTAEDIFLEQQLHKLYRNNNVVDITPHLWHRVDPVLVDSIGQNMKINKIIKRIECCNKKV